MSVLAKDVSNRRVTARGGTQSKALERWIADLSAAITLGDVASTFASGDATPSVLNNSKFITAGSTAITTFDDGVEGQTITIYRGASDIAINDTATIDPIIAGNLALTTARPSATFRLASGVWKQVEEAGATSSAMLPVAQAVTKTIAADLLVAEISGPIDADGATAKAYSAGPGSDPYHTIRSTGTVTAGILSNPIGCWLPNIFSGAGNWAEITGQWTQVEMSKSSGTGNVLVYDARSDFTGAANVGTCGMFSADLFLSAAGNITTSLDCFSARRLYKESTGDVTGEMTGLRVQADWSSTGASTWSGVYVEPPTNAAVGVTAAFRSGITSGSLKYGIYINGSAKNYVAGNFGIGYSLPDAPLHVQGSNSPQATGILVNASNYGVTIGGIGSQAYGQVQGLQYGTGYADLILNPAGNNVGIGSGATTPTAKLHVDGAVRGTTFEVGDQSDTTLARIAAGRVSVEGVELARLNATQTFLGATTLGGNNVTAFNRTDGNAFCISFTQTGSVVSYIGANATYGLAVNNSGFTKALNWDSTSGGLTCDAVTTSGALAAYGATAIPAGGTTGAGVKVSSTANFGIFFGSGAPTLSAAKGSLYLRSDGSGTNDRMYVNTNGSTTWTAVVTVA